MDDKVALGSEVFLDTAYTVALSATNDEHHAKAVVLSEQLGRRRGLVRRNFSEPGVRFGAILRYRFPRASSRPDIMPTIVIEGYKFRFYSSDGNEPPHVHVLRGEREAKIWLQPLEVEYNRRYNRAELTRILKLAQQHQARLVKAW